MCLELCLGTQKHRRKPVVVHIRVIGKDLFLYLLPIFLPQLQ